MSERAQKILSIFWSAGPDTLSRPVFELTVNIRCGEDEWYGPLIAACREGSLSEEQYNFLHGYPTLTVGSFMCSWSASSSKEECEKLLTTGKLLCGNEDCRRLMTTTWRDQRREGLGWVSAQALECEVCQRERKRRNRLLRNKLADLDAGFAVAPYITHMNRPRYLAWQQRR